MCGGIINAKEAKEWRRRKNEQQEKPLTRPGLGRRRRRRRGRTLKLSRVTFHELAKCNKLPQPRWHLAKFVGNRQKGFSLFFSFELNMPRNLCGFHRNSMAPKGIGLSNLHTHLPPSPSPPSPSAIHHIFPSFQHPSLFSPFIPSPGRTSPCK